MTFWLKYEYNDSCGCHPEMAGIDDEFETMTDAAKALAPVILRQFGDPSSHASVPSRIQRAVVESSDDMIHGSRLTDEQVTVWRDTLFRAIDAERHANAVAARAQKRREERSFIAGKIARLDSDYTKDKADLSDDGHTRRLKQIEELKQELAQLPEL